MFVCVIRMDIRISTRSRSWSVWYWRRMSSFYTWPTPLSWTTTAENTPFTQTTALTTGVWDSDRPAHLLYKWKEYTIHTKKLNPSIWWRTYYSSHPATFSDSPYAHSRVVTHAALHRGHTARRSNHICRQHVWNTWPHAPMRSVCPDASLAKWSTSLFCSVVGRMRGAGVLRDSLHMLHVSNDSSRSQVPKRRRSVRVTLVVILSVMR